jgi:DNA-binding transcriptional ArsR family regulator
MAEEEGTLLIKDVQTLKVVADPFRQELLGLIDGPRTVRELADKIGRPADRLYYHLSLLERHGIVKADEQRGAERRYRPTAAKIDIDPAIVIPSNVVTDLIGGLLQRAHKEYAEAVRDPEPDGVRRTLVAMHHVRLTEEERQELTEQLVRLTAEFEARKPKKSDKRRTYGVLRGIWPVAD